MLDTFFIKLYFGSVSIPNFPCHSFERVNVKTHFLYKTDSDPDSPENSVLENCSNSLDHG